MPLRRTIFHGNEQTALDDEPLVIGRLYFTAGQNSKGLPNAIDLDEVVSLQNATLARPGVRTTRTGSTLIANDVGSTTILGLANFYREGGTKYLTMVAGSTWYQWSGSGSWTSIVATLSSGLETNFIVAANRIFLMNGTDNVQSWDGSTLTDEGNSGTSFPKSRFAIYHQNRVIASGNVTNRSYVWYSAVLNPQSWDRAANALKVSDQDNEEVTALVNFSKSDNPGFVVFKTRSTYFVDTSNATPSNWSIIPIDPAHGCYATRTAIAIGSSSDLGGDVIYLSREGEKYRVRSLIRTISDSIGTGGILSNAIEDVLDDVSDPNMTKACAFYFDNKYFLSFPSGSSSFNDTICVLDLSVSDPSQGKWKWSVWKGINASVFSLYEQSSVERLYFGNASADSIVLRLSGTSDNGTAIEFIEEGRREDFEYPELRKSGEHVEVYFLSTETSTATVSVSLDGAGYTTLGTVNLTSGGPALPINLPFFLGGLSIITKKFAFDNLGPWRTIQVKVTHNTLDTTVSYLGYTIAAFPIPLELGD